MEPLISVIIPVHNSSSTLSRCVDSVRANSYKNLEIILVENASSDDSLKLCRNFAGLDGRIKVLSLEKGGVSLARNAGLCAASGEYFSFVDSDDFVAEDMFSSLLQTALESGADMTFCRFFSVENSQKTLAVEAALEEFAREKRYYYLFDEHSVSPSAYRILYKFSLFGDLRFDESLPFAEDRVFLCDCLLRAERLAVCEKGLYYYVIPHAKVSLFVKYFGTVENALQGVRKTTELARGFLEAVDCAEVFKSYKYEVLCSLCIMAAGVAGSIKKPLADPYWREANSRPYYKAYKKYHKSFRNRVKGFLVRYKLTFLLKIAARRK